MKFPICLMRELIAYAERCKEQNRGRQIKYYPNTVKNDPKMYKRFLEKCQKNSSTCYYSKVVEI